MTDHRQVPPWWSGNAQLYAAAVDLRSLILSRDRASSHRIRTGIAGTLFILGMLWIPDLAGATAISTSIGETLRAICCVTSLLLASLWLLERRLSQQLCDLELYADLWVRLVTAVRNGQINRNELEHAKGPEDELERLLRGDAAVAAQWVGSPNVFTPRLPLMGQCFALSKS